MPVIKLLDSNSLYQHEEIESERYYKLKEKIKMMPFRKPCNCNSFNRR